jgi:hypothetical protein
MPVADGMWFTSLTRRDFGGTTETIKEMTDFRLPARHTFEKPYWI